MRAESASLPNITCFITGKTQLHPNLINRGLRVVSELLLATLLTIFFVILPLKVEYLGVYIINYSRAALGGMYNYAIADRCCLTG